MLVEKLLKLVQPALDTNKTLADEKSISKTACLEGLGRGSRDILQIVFATVSVTFTFFLSLELHVRQGSEKNMWLL